MRVDGSSDEPLAAHVKALAAASGVELEVVVPDLARLDPAPARTVKARLGRVMEFDHEFEVLVVHRDAEKQSPAARRAEIDEAAAVLGVAWHQIPVIPVRMTEAWLLLDEHAIRRVAGKPTGTIDLALPAVGALESLADPKDVLSEALERACGLSGRRLASFRRDFPQHRRQLIERIDRDGRIRELRAWKALETSTRTAMDRLLRGDQASCS